MRLILHDYDGHPLMLKSADELPTQPHPAESGFWVETESNLVWIDRVTGLTVLDAVEMHAVTLGWIPATRAQIEEVKSSLERGVDRLKAQLKGDVSELVQENAELADEVAALKAEKEIIRKAVEVMKESAEEAAGTPTAAERDYMLYSGHAEAFAEVLEMLKEVK